MKSQFLRAGSLFLAASVFLSACTAVQQNIPTPTPIPTPPISHDQIVYPVSRGTIEQQVQALGRVASSQVATLYFTQAGRLFHLSVDLNQTVKKGDLLAELDTSSMNNSLKAAQIQAEVAQLQVDQAMGKTLNGGTSPAVLAAQSAVHTAEANYAQAQATLDDLLQGPTVADLTAAQAKVATAQSTLQKDRTALANLQATPTPDQITVAQSNLDKARAALQQAQAAYDLVKFRPNVAALSQSTVLEQATTAFNAAQAAYNLATVAPRSDQVQALQKQVNADQASLNAANAQLALLKQGATQADVDAAQQGVKSSQAQLDQARQQLATATGNAAGQGVAVQIAQKQAELAKLQLATLQEQFNAAKLRAPFDGVVTETDAKDGDDLAAYAPVLILANPAKLEIQAVLQPTDITQVALGQPATIVFNAYPTAKLTGKVIRMPSIATGNTSQLPDTLRTVGISFPATPGKVSLDDLANVTIDVQRKDGVLMLPNVAIQQSGGNQFVQVVGAGNLHREVYIQTGITDGTNTEILTGLQVGQKVLGPSAANVASQATPVPSSGGN